MLAELRDLGSGVFSLLFKCAGSASTVSPTTIASTITAGSIATDSKLLPAISHNRGHVVPICHKLLSYLIRFLSPPCRLVLLNDSLHMLTCIGSCKNDFALCKRQCFLFVS